MKYQIDKDIPMPEPRRNLSEERLLLAAMDVGDSFQFPAEQRGRLGNVIGSTKDKKFAVRKMSPGMFRVWRVA